MNEPAFLLCIKDRFSEISKRREVPPKESSKTTMHSLSRDFCRSSATQNWTMRGKSANNSWTRVILHTRRILPQHQQHRLQKRPFGSKGPSTNTTDNNTDFGGPLFPYSGSLPSPGYEWCRRCNIPSRQLQKAIGEHNPCCDRPAQFVTLKLLGIGICPAAWRYYQQQFATMAILTAFIFVALPPGTTFFGSHDDDDE